MTRCLTGAFVFLVVATAVWPFWFGERFAFRDVSHFYLPLYDYVSARTAEEWLPLWNPLDQTGIPLVGESTTAVLYPIRRAVFALPVSTEFAMNVYLTIHLLIAGMAAAWLAKRSGAPTIGATAAGIVYPLSGCVFALCCNPPFLAGAAWIPIALGAFLYSQRGGHGARSALPRIAAGGFAITMMVLAGDPQSAFHCALAVVTICVARSVRAREFDPGVKQMMSVVAASCVLAAGLSAIQIAASLDWSLQSDRVHQPTPRQEAYDFSLPPWHLAELVTPMPFGSPFPINQRISKLIPGDGRMWTPSIYAGLVLGLAMIARIAGPRRSLEHPWLAVCLVSLLLSAGHFAGLWIIQQFPGAFAETPSAVGSPFWMLRQAVPGYDSFRYPVKWLPMFAIAGTMVMAHWVSETPTRTDRYVALTLGISILIAVATTQAALSGWVDLDARTDVADEFWGPLDVEGGLRTLRLSLLWSFALLSAVAVLRHVDRIRSRRWAGWLLLVVIGVDGIVGARWLLPTVDYERERRVSHQADPDDPGASRTIRTQAGNWPEIWTQSSSPERALEVAASERVAWFGRWHLVEKKAVFNSMVSIRSRAISEFWSAIGHQTDELDSAGRAEFWLSVRRWLAIDGISHTDGSTAIAADGLDLVDVERARPQRQRRVRLFTRSSPVAPMSAVLDEVRRTGGKPIPHVAFPEIQQARATRGEIDELSDNVFVVHCDGPCVLERTVFQDGNWTATLSPKNDAPSGRSKIFEVSVYSSSHLNQAIRVPEGTWVVRFDYRPWWRLPAILVSAVSALVWIALVLISWLDRIRGRSSSAAVAPEPPAG